MQRTSSSLLRWISGNSARWSYGNYRCHNNNNNQNLVHLRSVGVTVGGRPSSNEERRNYVSRAHPKPTPEYAVPDAIARILKDIERRKKKRIKRLEYYERRKKAPSASTTEPKEEASTTKDPKEVRHPIETFELAIMLNLDPRKPGQSLRGSITLPHGTGKKGRNVIVLTGDTELAAAAQAAGAWHAGGEAIVDQLVSGSIAVDSIAAVLAMADMMPVVTKKAARLLGPRGLMPNAKVGTIHTQQDTLLTALESAVAGKEVTYRTEKEGIVHVPVGNHTFSVDKLLDNIGTIMKTILDAKPDSYGKGKKVAAKKGQALSAKSQPKYMLRVVMSSTQSPGFRIDLRTLDPNSAFFLSTLDPLATRRSKEGTTTIATAMTTSGHEKEEEGDAPTAGRTMSVTQ